jgi:conjugal transfer/type IV secretion protein DotA/TraY
VVYGAAGLAPAFGGYCLLQVIVVWIAVISGQIGNRMYDAFLRGVTFSTPDMTAQITPNLTATTEIVRDVLFLETCAALSATVGGRPPSGSGSLATPRVTEERNGALAQSWNWVQRHWGGGQASTTDHREVVVYDYGRLCGSVRTVYGINKLATNSAQAAQASFDQARRAAFEGLRNGVGTIARDVPRMVAPNTPQSDVSPAAFRDIAARVLQGPKADFDRAMLNAASTYVNTAGVSRATSNEMRVEAREGGWVTAGVFYMTVARMSSQITDTIRRSTDYASSGGIAESIDEFLATPEGRRFSDRVRGGITRLQQEWDALINGADISLHSARAGQPDQSFTIVAFLQHFLSADSLIQRNVIGLAMATPGQGRALQSMVNLGNWILDVASAIFVGSLILLGFTASRGMVSRVISSAAGSAARGVFGGAAWAVSLLLFSIALGLFMAGVYLAFILPMLPFFFFFMAVMAILVLVAEAVIAAPLWALAHVRMDGQEFADGPNKAGYIIVFNLLLRIPLTLLGLWFSYLVFEAMIWLLGKTFMPALVAGTSTGVFGVIGTLVAVFMVTVLTYQCATRSFALITAVPDRVSRWFGANADNPEESNTNVIMGAVGRVESGGREAAQTAMRAAPGGYAKQLASRGMKPTANPLAGGPKTPDANASGRETDKLKRE